MRKLATVTLAVLLVGLFAAVVYAAVDAGDDSPVGTTDTSPTTETTETPATKDGQPAERRHRHRHRHLQATAPASGVDVSGPCDEAEHANDPRCAGVQPRVDDDDLQEDDGDHSGPGHGGDGEHDNSGPGGGDDD